MQNTNKTTYFPGTRVLVFDSTLWEDDKRTPINETLNVATVRCWYAKESIFGKCKSLIDVEFDRRPGEVSKGHFTFGVRVVETPEQVEEIVRNVAKNAPLTPDQECSFRKKLFESLKTHETCLSTV